MRPVIFTDVRMLDHVNATWHPEAADRLRAVHAALRAMPEDSIEIRTAPPAARGLLDVVHDPEYVARILSLRGRTAQLDSDTAVGEDSVDAALLAAGAAVAAVDTVVEDPRQRAWALVRPPGHHAESNRAMGFCLFDNVAVAAEHARRMLGLERILIVDWDVHHGNGTQEIFEARRDVLFFSSHQFPLYPGTGAVEERGTGAGLGYTVNVPLPAGAGDDLVLAVYRSLLPVLAERFDPDLVLVSAGYDAHRDDPLGGLEMTTDGFTALTALVLEIADRHANGRVAFMLEGGYDLRALAGSVRAGIEVCAGAPAPDIPTSTDPAITRFVDPLLSAHERAATG